VARRSATGRFRRSFSIGTTMKRRRKRARCSFWWRWSLAYRALGTARRPARARAMPDASVPRVWGAKAASNGLGLGVGRRRGGTTRVWGGPADWAEECVGRSATQRDGGRTEAGGRRRAGAPVVRAGRLAAKGGKRTAAVARFDTAGASSRNRQSLGIAREFARCPAYR